jgi:Type IV secretory system Conjugative DNA transfer
VHALRAHLRGAHMVLGVTVETFRNLAMAATVLVVFVVGLLWWSSSRRNRGWSPRMDWRDRWYLLMSTLRRRRTPATQHTVASDSAAATLSSGVSQQEADIITGKADPTRQVCLGAIIPNTPLAVEVERSREWMRRAIRGERKIEDPANRYQDLRRHSDDLLAAYSPVGLSTLVVGPSGTGKSSGVIIPATLTCGTSSMLNLSVKRDVCEITYKQRHLVARRWNETKSPQWPAAFCVVFDPSGPENLPPALAGGHVYWSPLTLILKDTREDLQTAKNLATSMVDAAGSDSGAHRSDTESFWRNSAARLLSRVMWAVVATKRDRACMWDVCEVISSLSAAGRAEALEEALSQHILNLETTLGDKAEESAKLRTARTCLDTLGEIAQHLERNAGGQVSGVLGNLQNALECFEDSALGRHPAGRQTVPFDDLLETWSTLYLTADGTSGKVFRPVLAALTDALLDYASVKAGKSEGGKLRVPMVACLDELTNLSAMDSQKLVRLISTARGYNISVILAFQDLSQLTARFGDAVTRTIVSNTHGRIFLPKNGDSETAKTAETMFGNRLAPSWTMSFTPSSKAKSVSHSYGEAGGKSTGYSVNPETFSESLTLREEPILPAHRLAASTSMEAWAWVSGFTYHLLQRRWYEYPLYKQLAEGTIVSTDLCSDEISTTLDELSPDVVSEAARRRINAVTGADAIAPRRAAGTYSQPRRADQVVGTQQTAAAAAAAAQPQAPPVARRPVPTVAKWLQ